MSKLNISTLSSMNRSIIHEPPEERLQRDIDSFTKKLELEKRRLVVLEDQFSCLHSDLKIKRKKYKEQSHIKQKLPTKQKNNKRIKVLENQLEHSVIKYNEKLSENKKLRNHIDQIRREKKQLDLVQKTLEKEVVTTSKIADETNKKQARSYKEIEEYHKQMTLLQVKSEEENNIFTSELGELENHLKVDKKMKDVQMKEFNKTLFSKKVGGGLEVLDSTPILRKLHAKWARKNFEKKKEIDIFIKNMRAIEDAFVQIKEATGIIDEDEIVTTFIKSEEQNQSLYNQVSLLQADIDQLEEQANNDNKLINKYEKYLGEETINNELEVLDETIVKNTSVISNNKIKIENVNVELKSIQDSVSGLIKKFQKTKFNSEVITNVQNTDDIEFNAENIGSQLMNLEDQINILLYQTAEEKPEMQRDDIFASPMRKKIQVKNFNGHGVTFESTMASRREDNIEDLSDEEEEEKLLNQPLDFSDFKERSIRLLEKRINKEKHDQSKTN